MVSTIKSKTYIITDTSETTITSQSQSVTSLFISKSITNSTTNTVNPITDWTSDTSKSTTTIKEFPIIIGSILNSTGLNFNFAQLTSSQAVDLLKLDYNLDGCLLNCSNKGICTFNPDINKLFCLCNSVYLIGDSCQIDSRPCSSNPCLNNGSCSDNSNKNSFNSTLEFKCSCDRFYEGRYCESRIDVCKNETCNGNGKCEDVNSQAKCKCFSMFLGEKCEVKSEELVKIQSVISTATLIAIIAVGLFYCSFIAMDLSKVCVRNRNKNKWKKYGSKKVHVQKFTYVN